MMKNNMHSTQGRQLKGTNTGKCSHQHRLLGTPQQIPPLTILLQRLPRSPAPRVRFDYHTRSTLRCLPASYTSSRQCVWEGRGEGRRGDGGALKPIIFRVRASKVPSNRKKWWVREWRKREGRRVIREAGQRLRALRPRFRSPKNADVVDRSCCLWLLIVTISWHRESEAFTY